MVAVTSAELGAPFAPVRERAMREPVPVEHDGEVSVVVLSAEEFARLKSLDDRRAYYVWELPDDLAKALDAAVPGPESLRYPDE